MIDDPIPLDPDTYEIPFGRWRGYQLAEVDLSYLLWLLTSSGFIDQWLEARHWPPAASEEKRRKYLLNQQLAIWIYDHQDEICEGHHPLADTPPGSPVPDLPPSGGDPGDHVPVRFQLPVLILLALLLPGCSGWKQWTAGAVLLGGTAYALHDRAQEHKETLIDLPRPAWISDSRLEQVLVAPGVSIYSSHVRRRTGSRNLRVTYGGVPYQARSIRHLQDPRAWVEYGALLGATDIALIRHDPVAGIPPADIADPTDIAVGDPVHVWLDGRVVLARIVSIGPGIMISYPAIPGDSSTPVTLPDGRLVSMLSVASGYGPNLTLIKDLLQ